MMSGSPANKIFFLAKLLFGKLDHFNNCKMYFSRATRKSENILPKVMGGHLETNTYLVGRNKCTKLTPINKTISSSSVVFPSALHSYTKRRFISPFAPPCYP